MILSGKIIHKKRGKCLNGKIDMQYWEVEIWIMAEYMKTSFASKRHQSISWMVPFVDKIILFRLKI